MPLARPDTVITLPGQPVTFRVLDNDEGSGLALVAVSSPAFGSLAVHPDQAMTYTPAPGFVGSDGFTYTVRDGAGATAEAGVTVQVNSPPVARDDVAATGAGTAVSIAVLANDDDPDGDPLSLVTVANPGHGSVEVLPSQELRYQPQQGFTGSDSFAYSVTDSRGGATTAMVTVTVSDPNRPPTATPDTVTTAVDTPVTIQILANDSDPDGDPLSLAGVTLPAHGTLLIHPDRSVTYAPAAAYAGDDGFTYTISDGRGGTATGAVTVTVVRPNSAPVAVADLATTPADTPVTLDLLANDSDPDGDPLSLIGLSTPAHGSLALAGAGRVTYTPSPGFAGEDVFTYTISDGRGGTAVGEARVTVEPPPSAPTFANGYAWRRRLVVPPRPLPATTLEGFVLYVDVSGGWLRTSSLGGRVESAQGFDLRFELEDGSKLAHEIDLYDPAADNGTKGRLVAWVRVPGWAIAEQLRLFLYYGKPGLAASEADPAAAWAGYVAVWDAGSGADRSGQGRGLTMSGVVPQPLLGGAGAFDGAGAHGRRTAAQGVDWLGSLSAMTVQAVVKSNVTGQRRGIIAQGPQDGTDSTSSLFLAYVEASWANATKAVQFQWRNAIGSNFIVSQSNKQTTSRQIIHATWSQGQAPRLYLDGVEQTAPAARGTGTGDGVTPNGDLWLGVAPGPLSPASTGWNGLIDEVRIHPAALSAEHVATEAANQGSPAAFYGLGGEEAVDGPPAAVALPLTATTPSGQRIDIDAVAAAFAPAGSSPVTLTAVGQPQRGLATIVGGKLRYTPNAGYVGPDSFTYTLADAAGRSSVSQVAVTVTAPGVAWAGPKSKLAWHSGGFSDLNSLEALRTNPANGKVREIDMAQLFSPHGGWDKWTGATFAQSNANSQSTTYMNTRGTPALNFALRVFPASNSTEWQGRTVASWPSKGSLSANAWISPRIPVGHSSSITNDATRRAQAMEVWQRAADGHFDHIWGPRLAALWSDYFTPLLSGGRRLVLRPFWESNGAWKYGQNHALFGHSICCAQTQAEANIVKAGMARFNTIARTELPGVVLHFCPLKGGETTPLAITAFIDPNDWDIIGPDYYDLGLAKGPPYNNGTWEDRWNQQANETGPGGGPKGINRWIDYVRGTGKRFGIGEWGVWPFGDNNGGGDNPTFIRKMFELFQANGDIMAYDVYFNSGSAGHRLAPSGSDYPNASAAYREKWGTLV